MNSFTVCFFSIYKSFLFHSLLDFEGEGRGALATRDLQVGDIALEIPVSLIISEDLVHVSDMVWSVLSKVKEIVES